ncbi:MAG: hypothetical protein Q9166_000640 [cf. Caloplaca sp. 2 TL-2023]
MLALATAAVVGSFGTVSESLGLRQSSCQTIEEADGGAVDKDDQFVEDSDVKVDVVTDGDAGVTDMNVNAVGSMSG